MLLTNADDYGIMIVSNERKIDMKNLGIMNGWKEQPKEYTKHLAECGQLEPTVWAFMKDGKPCRETRMVRRYNTTVEKVGKYSVKRTETCNDCGCSWQSWS